MATTMMSFDDNSGSRRFQGGWWTAGQWMGQDGARLRARTGMSSYRRERNKLCRDAIRRKKKTQLWAPIAR
jgi:hypothetical protein